MLRKLMSAGNLCQWDSLGYFETLPPRLKCGIEIARRRNLGIRGKIVAAEKEYSDVLE